MSETDSFLDVSIADGVAVVTMNRGPVNAQNSAFRTQVTDAFDGFSDREDVRCVVLTGAGRAFSAGADLRERSSLAVPGGYWQHSRRVREAFNAIRECAKPVIAAVNGPAIGAGFALMASCDIMVASEDAVFAMTEIDVGLAGGTAMLTALVGKSNARLWFMTARRIPAAELYRLGIISACVPRAELMDHAMAVAREIASKSPTGIRYAKTAFNTVETMPPRDGYRLEQGFTYELSKTDDAAEAQRAFLEKRKPLFSGS